MRDAIERLDTYNARCEAAHATILRAKLGLLEARDGDLNLAAELFRLMQESEADFTLTFRRMIDAAEASGAADFVALFASAENTEAWLDDWRTRLAAESTSPEARREEMRRHNPVFIPRNHQVEAALEAARNDDLAPFERPLRVLSPLRRPTRTRRPRRAAKRRTMELPHVLRHEK